ncbi:uncharacterized protein [Macaca nemestrina]|uniref:uncharacterized protein LOC114679400 n=1 Tax=Macaca mulatta TaxID=9544 RepID=UPI00075FED27|nr:uncharacterized protein LOC114679400 [Macaca mulatta]XP_050653172.1 uncharacterized protein LOC126958711 [Macaca thibetana thibetana]
MVAAAAPSSALACGGLLAAARRAGPERQPRGGDGVAPRQRRFCGRLEVGSGREEEGRRGRARPLAPRYPLSGQLDGPAGLSGEGNGRRGRRVLGALCCGAERRSGRGGIGRPRQG